MISITNLKKNDLISQIVNEVKVMSLLSNCKYIIKLIDHFEDDTNLYFVMELANQGTLMDLLNRNGKLKEKVAAKIMRDVILALEFLHSKNIMHRDLKPENVLLDSSGYAKLSDFGWSIKLSGNDDRRRTFCGTPDYISPEMVDGKEYDSSIDIWCCGVMLYEMLHGVPPFTPLGDHDPNIKEKKIYDNIKKMRIADAQQVSQVTKEAQNLINALMHKNPKERIKIPQIKAHPWFALYKITFDENRGSTLTASNMLSDSMLNEDDPFDDFLNGRLNRSTAGKSAGGSGDYSPEKVTRSLIQARRID